MSRLLVVAERKVDVESRDGYLRDMTARRQLAKASGANFWVFEACEEVGRFLEFIEGGSEGALADAQGGRNPGLPLWREVAGG